MSNSPYYRNYSQEEFEVQYNARLQVPDSERYVAQNEMLSAEYRSIADVELDVEFGERPLARMDLFKPIVSAQPAPVHLFIHGGYWRSRTKESFSFIARPLVERGAMVAVTSYSLCPDVRIRDIAEEMCQAVTWLHANVADHGGDPENIHVSGHSAGGHLAAVLAQTDWPSRDVSLPADLVKSCVAVSGLFELEPMILHSINELLNLDENEANEMSPARRPIARSVPIEVFVGGDESELFREQSSLLCSAWKDQCPNMGPTVLDGHNHFTILSDQKDADFPVTSSIIRLMGLQQDLL